MTYDAKQRLKILTFQENHGMAAACDAFKIGCRTLYRWRQTLREAGHNAAALAPRSTRTASPTADAAPARFDASNPSSARAVSELR